jgi:hypothetical protein
MVVATTATATTAAAADSLSNAKLAHSVQWIVAAIIVTVEVAVAVTAPNAAGEEGSLPPSPCVVGLRVLWEGLRPSDV